MVDEKSGMGKSFSKSSGATSSYLSRLARTAGGSSGGASKAWISTSTSGIDHSSPAANLQSRLRRMESDYGSRVPIPQQPAASCSPPVNAPSGGHVPGILHPKEAPSSPHVVSGKCDVSGLRDRIKNVVAELQAIDADLSNLERNP
jgi:hypothetical protein